MIQVHPSSKAFGMTIVKAFKWLATLLLAVAAMAILFITLFGWNWLRQPIEKFALNKTGRVLAIRGDLTLKYAWPRPRFQAMDVTFANPAWAKEPLMLTTPAVEVTLDLSALSALLARRIVFPQAHLERPVVMLEQNPDGRKSWLLDLDQSDESARIEIDLLSLDQGTLGFDDAANKTRLRAEISTRQPGSAASDHGLDFSVQGQFKGVPVKAKGSGAPVLALRDETTPYALKIDAVLGRTHVRAEGHVTSLQKVSALDMTVALRGDNLDQLFPLIGIATPSTRAYVTDGHLVRAGNRWQYDKFKGRFGDSDMAGSITVTTGGQRPMLVADLSSNLLDIADLGPLIGARPGNVNAARLAAPANTPDSLATTAPPVPRVTPARVRVLPDLPFNTERWGSLDADVHLRAKTIRRALDMPLDNLTAHMLLRDSVLTLDPLDFGLAGGHLSAVISLDGRKKPIQARARVRAQKLQLAKLVPGVKLNEASIGQVNGLFDLSGTGNSVGAMLASANGQAGLVVAGGQISRLMMEKIGLHLWEMLALSLSGDQQIELRCAVADFDVRQGTMRPNTLLLDTAVTTISGTGSIDLAQERLDLTLNQKTKNTSPLALRSPIYIRGNFARPVAGVDKGQAAVRALGAAALGLVNPLLAVIPLIDPGPGQDSDCGRLLASGKFPATPEGKKAAPRK